MKIALVSHTLPPSRSGQAVILGRILEQLDPATYQLLSRRNYLHKTDDFIARLPGAYHYLPPEPQVKEFYFAEHIRKLNFILASIVRGRRIANIINRTGCQAIIACSGDIIDLPAACLAGRLAKVPFMPYLFDDYAYQWPAGPHRDMASVFERFIYRNQAGVIVPNEFMRREIERRHGSTCHIVPNCYGKMELPSTTSANLRNKARIDIVFTGTIYHMNFACFRLLREALLRLDRPGATLHLYTATERSILEDQGILGPQVTLHAHAPSNEINRLQQKADLLFLPIALNTPANKLPKNATPGKMGEYLASGVPILAMLPVDCYATWYLRKHMAGLVVDNEDPGCIDKILKEILFNDQLRQQVSLNARTQGQHDYSPQNAARNFLAAVETLV